MSPWAEKIYQDKYAWKDEFGMPTEVWPDTAHRVVKNVLGALGYEDGDEPFDKMVQFISERKFMPGGRYLYASGRDVHQVQNCALYRCEDSREGWAELYYKVTMALTTGAGVGIVYSDVRPNGTPIKSTGGEATGPLTPMNGVNDLARGIKQGGSRRAAIWAGLHWWHADIFDFIHLKDWSEDIKAAKAKDYNSPAPLDITNVSVILDDEFFVSINGDGTDEELEFYAAHIAKRGATAPDGGTWTDWAKRVYHEATKMMVETAEPGFSIDRGPNHEENLRNAPVVGSTRVLTDRGYEQVRDIVNVPRHVWTGKQFAPDVIFKRTGIDKRTVKVSMTGGREISCEPWHEFLVERYSGAGGRRKMISIDRAPANELKSGDVLHVSMPEVRVDAFDPDAYTLGYVYGDGSFGNGNRAEVTFCTEESKKCASVVAESSFDSNVTEADGRGYTRAYFSSDIHWSGRAKFYFPEEMYSQTPDIQASFIAGLWDSDGNFDEGQKRIRLASSHPEFLRGVGRLLEQLGILAGISKNGNSTYGGKQEYQLSVMAEYVTRFAELIPTQRIEFGDHLEGYKPYRNSTIKVLGVEEAGIEDVFCADVKVDEHSFMAEGVIISNCTEITSADDSDICNLGSINMARVESIDEFEELVKFGTLFLLAGTVYSTLPHAEIAETREKNRRLGLGVMGIHEWLLKRGYAYGMNDEFRDWLGVYATSTDRAAEWADKHGLSRPVKTRAIAPTGTIGIVAETTTGIEPIFCVAEKRRFIASDNTLKFQYVINPTAAKLIDQGVEPTKIESAYDLAYDYERRIKFQADVQDYVDHAISSTLNLPYPITDDMELELFKDILYKYLPRLRGVTCYPNGARAGQPLTAVPYEEAIGQTGVTFDEDETRACASGSCGA